MRAVKTILSLVLLFLVTAVIAKDVEDREELPREIRFAKQQTLVQPTLYHLPRYPTNAYKRGIDCEVWVKVKLNKEGKVDSAVVLYCEKENYGFEKAALEMAKKSKYTPNSIWKKYRKKWLYSQLLFTTKKAGWESAEFYDKHKPNLGDEFIGIELMSEIIYKSVPKYPRPAKLLKAEGTVFIRVLIGLTGRPIDVLIDKTTDLDWKYGFNKAALKSAMKCKFKPATQNSKPVKVWVSFPYEFILYEKR